MIRLLLLREDRISGMISNYKLLLSITNLKPQQPNTPFPTNPADKGKITNAVPNSG